MACCGSRGDPEQIKQNDKITKEIRQQKDKMDRMEEVKLLLLGPGESGKSTVFKQLKLIQDSSSAGFTDQDRLRWKQAVYSNCIEQMTLLVKCVAEQHLPFSTEEHLNIATTLVNLPSTNGTWTLAIAKGIMSLWSDPSIKSAYVKSAALKIQLNDTAEYFFENLPRIILDNYMPTNADILRARVRSTGIEEAAFRFDGMTFRVVDVGGQRSERRKWIHCFSDVKCIIFCAPLADYNQYLREQPDVNRMDEALDLFGEVTDSAHFANAGIILFLNKVDLFKEKLEKGIDLRCCFPQYQGGNNFDAACDFVKKRFLERVGNGRKIFIHFTCALDTEKIEHVIHDVRTTVITEIIGKGILGDDI